MDGVKIPKSEDGSTSSSKSDDSMGSGSISPTNNNLRKDETADEQNSQDDMKAETANSDNQEVGMSLRERRTRKRPSHLYSPDIAPGAPPAVERRASTRTEKSASGVNAKSPDMSNWLQCDLCHKWRLVHSNVFADLKKLAHFQCRNLQGVTCKDRDDWGESNGGSEDASMKDEFTSGRTARSRARSTRRINIFAGKYIPGFAAEFSDYGEE